MESLTTEDIFSALKTVKDPELGVNIVDLGLVYHIDIQRDDLLVIKITMTLTTPGCPLGSAIIAMIRDALAIYPFLNPEKDVIVEIVFDPPWTQDMMSDEAKAELGF